MPTPSRENGADVRFAAVAADRALAPRETTLKRKSQPKKGNRQSYVVAAAFVIAAGVITWFGVSRQDNGGTAAHVAAAAQTIAPADDGAPAEGPRKLEGALPTRLVVARAAVDAPVSEVGVVDDGKSRIWEVAWQSVGHHMDSARPGQPGNMVLTGHVSVIDRRNLAAFAGLNKVIAGDVVEVYSGQTVYKYSVTKVAVVAPSAVKVLKSDHTATVTLITCTPDLKNRLVVTGTLLESTTAPVA